MIPKAIQDCYGCNSRSWPDNFFCIKCKRKYCPDHLVNEELHPHGIAFLAKKKLKQYRKLMGLSKLSANELAAIEEGRSTAARTKGARGSMVSQDLLSGAMSQAVRLVKKSK